MKAKLLPAILVLLSVSGAAYAEVASPKVPAPAEAGPGQPAGKRPAVTGSNSPETFTPSEKVQADSVVSFPVDI